MSKRVLFVCVVLLLSGLLAGWHTLSASMGGKWYIDLGILFVPVSIGLFLGWPSARTAAVCLFCAIYALLAAGMILSFFPGSQGIAAVSGHQFVISTGPVMAFVISAIVGSWIGILHWMLYSPPFDDHLS